MTKESSQDNTHSLPDPSDPRVIPKLQAAGRDHGDARPHQIGPYRILETLGEGGMGVVYLAEQTKPIHRRVALKIIKLGMDTKQVIARFETEREALALMNHPNVAKVFDAGVSEQGRPFFVMEYVDGVPLTAYCDAKRLSTHDRLGLFVQVCQAIQHAHQKGIIHRDIKPSNVLVTEVDGKPTAKVIDFGIAKATQQRLTEATYFTEQGQLIGTPAYMSPEQADPRSQDIDTRTDIYSLGVLLYEMLVGELPFEAEDLRRAALTEIVRIIREVDPPKPSTRFAALGDVSTAVAQKRRTEVRTLARQLRADLDWVVMKCLEKDRTRRYETANALVMEIHRYLNNEPVLAGPPSAVYRLRKFVRKNRASVTAGVLVTLTLIVGIISTSVMTVQYRRATLREAARAEEAEWSAYVANLGLAQAAMVTKNWSEARRRINDCPTSKRGWEWHFLRLKAESISAHIPGVWIEFSPDSKLILAWSDLQARLWDTDGNPVGDLMQHDDNISTAAFSPDGTRVLTMSSGGSAYLWDTTGNLLTVIQHSGDMPQETKLHQDRAFARFNSDGTRIVTFGPDKFVRLWDSNGNQLSKIQHDGLSQSVCISPNGKQIVTTSPDNTGRLWDMSGDPVGEPMRHDAFVNSIVYSPNGSQILTIVGALQDRKKNSIYLWDTSGHLVGEQIRDERWAKVVVFSPDGKLMLAKTDHTGQLLDNLGQPVGKPMFSEHKMSSAVFSPDSKLILSWSEFGARFWDATGADLRELGRAMGRTGSAAFSRDGTHVLSTDRDHVSAWDLTGKCVGSVTIPGAEWVAVRAISPDGRFLLVVDGRNSSFLLRAGQLDSPERLLASTADEQQVQFAAAQRDGEGLGPHVRLSTSTAEIALEVEALQRDVTGARILDRRVSNPRIALPGGNDPIRVSAYSPDGARLVTATDDRAVRLWETTSWRQVAVLPVDDRVTDLQFTPDGTRLMVTFSAKKVRIFDTREASARQADRDERFAERTPAEANVDALLNGPTPIDALEARIRDNAELSVLRRLVALEVLAERVRDYQSEADAAFQKLREEHDTKTRVRAAAVQAPAPHPRVLELLLKSIEAWKPDARFLEAAAWRTVCKVAPSPEHIAEALDDAREAAALSPDDPRPQTTVLLAEFRSDPPTKGVDDIRKFIREIDWSKFDKDRLVQLRFVSLGGRLIATGLYEEAETLLIEAESRIARVNPRDPNLHSIRRSLLGLYEAWAPTGGEELAEKAEHWRRILVKSNIPNTP